jgi:23S rRNA (pseudouridine1915-N3)-methyltransferase
MHFDRIVFYVLSSVMIGVVCFKPSLYVSGVHRIVSCSRLFHSVNIYCVGKKNGGEEWIANGCAEYEKRLQHTITMKTHFMKSDEDLVHAATSIKKGFVFALDEHGEQLDSLSFASLLFKEGFQEGGSTVSFIIGAFGGLPKAIKENYRLIALSKMTFTHQMARLLLYEQIYRADEIRKGSSYHKA